MTELVMVATIGALQAVLVAYMELRWRPSKKSPCGNKACTKVIRDTIVESLSGREQSQP